MRRNLFNWLVVLALVLAGAGAAVGVILSGLIEGEIDVTVGQALQIAQPKVTKPNYTDWSHPYFISISDDKTKFTAAVEAYAAESFLVSLPISNLGDADLVAEFTLTIEPGGAGITIAMVGSGVINDVVQVAAGKWKFTLDAAANGGTPPITFDGLYITVALDKAALPGFYKLAGQIKVVEY